MQDIDFLIPPSLAELEDLIRVSIQTEQQEFQKFAGNLPSQLKKILVNKDIQEFTIRLLGEENADQHPEEGYMDDRELRLKIEQHNRISRPSRERERQDKKSRNRNQDGQGRKRKVRTTITPSKLQELNRIFEEYVQKKESERQSLKSIGDKVGLGYSTVLHKFREFKATKKVKGGALIASINQKRKYKKSKQIDKLITDSLKQAQFYTAVELSNYIQVKYGRKLSRSIISRHLGEMGYSYKNSKPKSEPNKSPQVKNIRKNYVLCLALLRDKYNFDVFYLDETVFSLSEVPLKSNVHSWLEGYLYLTMVISRKGIYRYEIRTLSMQTDQFRDFLQQAVDALNKTYRNSQKVIVMNMEKQSQKSNEILELRRKLKEKAARGDINKTKLFYLPPFSMELSPLEWMIREIKDSLKSYEYADVDDLKTNIDKELCRIRKRPVSTYFNKAEEYLIKSMNMESF